MRQFVLSITLGLMALTGAVTLAVLNANGRLVGKAWLLPYLYGGLGLLFVFAVWLAARQATEITTKPHIVPVGYGHLPGGARRNSGGDWVKPSGYAFTAEELLAGKQYADQGLIILNDGEPAYQLSIPGISKVGSSKLAFDGTLPRLDKSQGEAILTSVIRQTPNTSILNGLFDEMREQNVDCIAVAVHYRGDNHKVWWATDVEIERNVSVTGGLSIRGFSQRRIKAPRKPS